jgi:hypothetical protein
MRHFILLLVIPFLFSCKGNVEADGFVICSYNVQNMMDATLDGTEYEEYRPSEFWTEEMYRTRLQRLGRFLSSSRMRQCDLFVLEEIENERVLSDLVRLYLARWGYGYYAAVKGEGSAIAVGIISRKEPSVVRSHGVIGGRPVLEAVFPSEAGEVVVLALHARSRIDDDSEETRLECMRTVRAVKADHPDALVLACGDFNEDPDACLASSGQTAFVLAHHPSAPLFNERGSLVVCGERELVSKDIWYDPFLDDTLSFSAPGTYWYDGSWHRYDHIIGGERLFDGAGWEFLDFSVCAAFELLQTDGRPYAWDKKLLSGYSDHLPVILKLVRW